MPPYRRPDLPDLVLRDSSGAVIDYGNRWGTEGPPEDSYSRDSHPERFAPLHDVAEALLAHLVETYDVTVEDDPGCAADLLRGRDDVVRAVRLTPADPDAAPLTFVLTSHPSVFVHAGALHDFPFPGCGCDACDETALDQADELERTVLAVVAGEYREHVRGRGRAWVGMSMTFPDGHTSGEGRAGAYPKGLLARARRRLDALPGSRWAPWPVRSARD